MSIYYFPAFLLDGEQHGGALRSRQIYNYLIEGCGTKESVYICQFDLKSVIKKRPFFFLFSIIQNFRKAKGLSFKNKIKYAACYSFINHLNIGANHVALEQGANHTIFIGDILCEHSIDFDLYPHNIEFCVANQKMEDDGVCYTYIKRTMIEASRIFVISEFDAYISKIFNENVHILYYTEPFLHKSEQTSLEFERKYGKYYVAFGSFYNPPTLKGMLKLINNFEKLDFSSDYKLCISGFGSEKFTHLSSKRIHIVGSLDDEVLDNMIMSSQGIIIYQSPTTGWLTKIERLITYGKPIFINRSYIQALKRYKGIFTFYDL